MGGAFDPYYKWLGIPPKAQPADHYRLLGVDRFESDADVIDAAASKQMVYVRNCASGPRVDVSQKILNELAAARLCLLNPAKKAAYDERLRSELAVREPPEAEEPIAEDDVFEGPAPRPLVPVRRADPVPVISAGPDVRVSVGRVGVPSARRREIRAYALAALLVAMCALLVALLAGIVGRESLQSTEADLEDLLNATLAPGPETAGPSDGTVGEEDVSGQGEDGPPADPPPSAPEKEPVAPSEPVIPPLPDDAEQQINRGMADAATPPRRPTSDR